MAKITPEVEKYIVKHFDDYTYKQLVGNTKEIFKLEITVPQIGHLLRKHKLKKTNVVSWRTKGTPPANLTPIGHEHESSDGAIYVKVSHSRKTNERLQPKHKLIWEKYHNTKCPSNEVIIFVDGDKRNFNIDNLAKVTRRHLAYLNKHGMYGYSSDVLETAKALSEIEYVVNRL